MIIQHTYGGMAMKIYNVTDPEFKEYGRIVDGIDVTELVAELGKTECPADSVVYNPTVPAFEALPVAQVIQDVLCGTLPIQIGYTNGHNRRLNALEYHRSSEFNVAEQDIILLLARRQDLAEDFTMDTSLVKAFRVPAGVLVEVYATTLHYAPCQVDEGGYRCIVVLPKGTNYPLHRTEFTGSEDRLMTDTNKWLIAHPDGGRDPGAFVGLTGENLEV